MTNPKGAVNAETGKPVASVVGELTEHVSDQLLERGDKPRLPRHLGAQLGDNELRNKLLHHQGWLDVYVQRTPRNEGESLADYHSRLMQSGNSDGRLESILDMVANIDAHFAIQARERDAARRAGAEEEKQRERRERERLERNASPDPEQVRKLLSTIEDASVSEQFLDGIMQALSVHREAVKARKKLQSIYDDERRACAQLGRRAPARDEVPTPPQGCVDFDLAILRASQAVR